MPQDNFLQTCLNDSLGVSMSIRVVTCLPWTGWLEVVWAHRLFFLWIQRLPGSPGSETAAEQFFLKPDLLCSPTSLLESPQVGLWYQQPRAPFANCHSSVSLRDEGDEAISYPVDVKHFPF